MAEEIIIKEWTKQINIGDEIAYYKYRGWGNYCFITKVIGKTPTGSLKTANDDLVKLDGYSRKTHTHYEPVTDNIREKLKIQQKSEELTEIIKKTNFLDLTLKQINEIIDVINKKDE